MFLTPLGVRPAEVPDGQGGVMYEGTDPRDLRHALAGLVSGPGVLSGLTVTGRSDWSYAIAPGYYAAARPDNGGIVLGGNDAEELVATDPAPGTGSRIDIIYVQTQEYTEQGTSSDSFAWVAQGTASGTPVAPTLPPGSLELARKVVAAGDTSTSTGAAITNTVVRAGARSNPVIANLTGVEARSHPNATWDWLGTMNAASNTDFGPFIYRTSSGTTLGQGLEAKVPGLYQIDVWVRLQSATARVNLRAVVDGAVKRYSWGMTPGGNWASNQIIHTARLSAGQRLGIQLQQDSGAPVAVDYAYTTFNMTYLGS